MIDPMLSLAFTVHANPGVYALMLGSGISRTSGIPTGWDIVLDLVRKLAVLHGEQCEPDEATWYRNRYGAEPNYSVLLNEFARTPAERKQFLTPLFQPTEEERQSGRKIPTPAHHAIAELMARGYFRVVLTTNFDTLLEDALQETGVRPYIVRHSSDIAGAPPLSQGGCIVVKLHGDYLDTRIRNTPKELEKYETIQKNLLDRIIDEFGLIVCGWSAEWDTALRDSIARCKSRRYMTYWMSMGVPHHDAQNLINLRQGQVISSPGADLFFRDLADKVASLRDLDQPHPLSAKVVLATAKRFLGDPTHRIRLHDLIHSETERVAAILTDEYFPVRDLDVIPETIENRLSKYRDCVDVILPLLATGCYWGTNEHHKLWVDCLEHLVNVNDPQVGVETWRWLRYYPLCLLQYAGGMAAIASNQFNTLEALLTEPRHWIEGEQLLLLGVLFPGRLFQRAFYILSGSEDIPVPASDHFFDVLRGPLSELVFNEHRYDELFDRFEYFRGIFYSVLVGKQKYYGESIGRDAPLGRFAFKYRTARELRIQDSVAKEALSGNLRAYLNNSRIFKSPDHFLSAKAQFDVYVHAIIMEQT